MNGDRQAELARKMAELSTRFAAAAGDHRSALAAARQTNDRAALAEIAHKLAGSAAMFGHPAIGEAALELEEAAEAGADYSARFDRLDALLASLAD